MKPSHPLFDVFSEDEILRVSEILNLRDLDPERLSFIKSLDSIDVSACPGSGKTTLAVAKIILLVQNWDSTSQGICVLSHTNVAKNEIKDRFAELGQAFDVSGRPHFVGTIHSFLSRFLATPYLVSAGHPPLVIDTELTIRKRISLIPPGSRRTVEAFLSKKYKTIEAVVRASRADLEFPLDVAKFGAGRSSDSFKAVNQSIKQSMELGYFTDDEILLFAANCLEENPEIAGLIRRRFPFFILDEAQDTSREQMELLDLIFDPSFPGTIVQRLGDINQGIYDSSQSSYPREGSISISDSFRLNREIADFASSFAQVPVEPNGLKGMSGLDNPRSSSKVLILFEDSEIQEVLPTFSKVVRKTLSKEQISGGKIAAVGRKHRNEGEIKAAHFPSFVGEYHSPYNAIVGRQKAPRLNSFCDYVAYARTTVAESGELGSGVEILSIALFNGIGALSLDAPRLPQSGRAFRRMIDLLAEINPASPNVAQLFLSLLSFPVDLPRQAYEDVLREVSEVTTRLVEVLGSDKYVIRPTYFDSPSADLRTVSRETGKMLPNEFIQENVRIELGSIHSIKGETHAATLLLETFAYEHFIKSILPWMIGKKVNGAEADSPRKKDRLRLSYVAFTRPKYLLGLAVPFKSLGNKNQVIEKNIAKLEARGWNVYRIESHSEAGQETNLFSLLTD